MPVSPFGRDALRDIIVDRFSEHADAEFTLLSEGWDSVAVDVDDRWIFKFPRHARGEAALRREAGILALVRAAVRLPVPNLELFDRPQIFSRHAKIAGEHLVTAQYNALPPIARHRLGEALGRFYAELHQIEPAAAEAVGILPAEEWMDADDIERRIAPVLPEALKPFADATLAEWADLTPDPLGTIYGFFDGHGWNMAFDHAAGKLNGIYDFADSGIGPLHREFVYSSFISPELTERIIGSYEHLTGRHIDRRRVAVLTGAHRLWELAAEADKPDEVLGMLASVAAWANR
ncbi:phosphotransferase family protein [Devosia sp. SL43]|uniref:phosphotransferase family protein n=1 Tax=Devosia sp. SL43 TaxID=2806348 RepID=UPI001F40E243|nr:aminoglycoside phosphotransferase family protein [Devosia sp. SL43]UJW85280.1 aminoglycoside phosphotransferase family protein [Devosia sp. SL43]